MKITLDSCTIILLAKASVLEIVIDSYDVIITQDVYKEVIKGKEKSFQDALLLERLGEQKKFKQRNTDAALTKKLVNDFNMGVGEASVISCAMKQKDCVAATDNRQGRNAAKINNLPFVGSIEIVVALFKNKKITFEKTMTALKILRIAGWFDDYLIENAMEAIKK